MRMTSVALVVWLLLLLQSIGSSPQYYHMVESYSTITRIYASKHERFMQSYRRTPIKAVTTTTTTSHKRRWTHNDNYYNDYHRSSATRTTTQLYSKYLSQLVSGAMIDERFDMRIFPGPLRGIGTVPNMNPEYIYTTIRPNTKIAIIPAQNVLIVSNFRRDKYNYQQLIQQQQQKRPTATNLSYNDFSMWDRDLAILLWKEYLLVVQQKKAVTSSSSSSFQQQQQQSRNSPLTGYIEYLCQQDALTQQENNPYSELYDENFYSIPLEEVDIDTYVPPSTAPHTLRRWSTGQRAMLLSQYDRGQELIQIANLQEQIWGIKYDSIRVDPTCRSKEQNLRMSYEQFVWAMEVVHSRAFCGLPIILNTDDNQSSSSPSTSSSSFSAASNWKNILKSVLPGILAPLFAATIGYVYAISTLYPNEIVLMILAMLGAIPVLLQLFQSVTTTVSNNVVVPSMPFSSQSSPTRYKNVDQSAVLLPIIDSANHSPDAMKDTNIVYNPLQHTFEWMIGPKSFVASTNIERPPLRRRRQQPQPPLSFENTVPTMTITSNDLVPSISLQVCISYGKQPKSDIEWMMNYGFLPGVSIDADIDNFDQYRYFLSQQFLERNP